MIVLDQLPSQLRCDLLPPLSPRKYTLLSPRSTLYTESAERLFAHYAPRIVPARPHRLFIYTGYADDTSPPGPLSGLSLRTELFIQRSVGWLRPWSLVAVENLLRVSSCFWSEHLRKWDRATSCMQLYGSLAVFRNDTSGFHHLSEDEERAFLPELQALAVVNSAKRSA